MLERKARANFVLDQEATDLLRVLIDQHEKLHGFRPSMSQFITGLIRKEAWSNTTGIRAMERAAETLIT